MAESTLLIEIGTEELPPRALPGLSRAFTEAVIGGLAQAGLAGTSAAPFATPRRLAVQVRGLPRTQPERTLERKGPALQAAFDADGQPSKAALGFARSCGVEVGQLERIETDKGAWLAYRAVEPGRGTAELVPEIVTRALAALPVPKRMRWGDGDTEFVRPVHWVVLMLDSEPIDAEILGIAAGTCTRGHRFHGPGELPLAHADDYERTLERDGRVIADFARRRALIAEQVADEARKLAAQALANDDLLDEVTALVEWPVALAGRFEEAYLRVPPEALISTMQGNQKYFPLRGSDGALLPAFITIANLDSRDPERVRAGNERVVRPRLADAAFFWDQDRRTPLHARAAGLAGVVFQNRLGTLQAKSERVAALAAGMADTLGAAPAPLARAAELAKCDLLTEMVGEFPELQGTMGRYYATNDGEPDAVALALEEQYLPRFAGDALPGSPIGRALALAERLDTLAGIFVLGQRPSGARDPFALRRAALGVLRILIEDEVALDLHQTLAVAVARQPLPAPDTLVDELFDFMLERLRAYCTGAGSSTEQFEAVLARRPTVPLDFHRRLQAVAAFAALPQASSLAAANKRIRNILRQADTTPAALDPARLNETAEHDLAAALQALETEAAPLLACQDYTAALTAMAQLRVPVDTFFDQVLVMAEDPAVRDNRLALLSRVSELFLQVADVSQLPVEQNT